MKNKTIDGKAWGAIVAAIIVIVFVIAFYCYNLDKFTNVDKFTKVFTNNNIELKQQPMVFTKQYLSVPGSCKPYSGCFFPATMSNPISLKTGKRVFEPKVNKVYCEEAWRDCNAYQNCIDGKCVPKNKMI